MDKITIWTKDNNDGSEPLPSTIRREGDNIRIDCDLFMLRIQIETLLKLLGDEGHGLR